MGSTRNEEKDAFIEADFALPAQRPERRRDYLDIMAGVRGLRDEDFWANRPYQPNVHEAHWVLGAVALLGLLAQALSTWFPILLPCIGAVGITAIIGGLILIVQPHANAWWRLIPLAAIACGLVEVGSIVVWLTGPHVGA